MKSLIEKLRTERSVYDAELCDEAADALANTTAELEQRREQVDELQQILDEITVALGSLGLSQSEIVDEVRRLKERIERLEAALEVVKEFLDGHATEDCLKWALTKAGGSREKEQEQ